MDRDPSTLLEKIYSPHIILNPFGFSKLLGDSRPKFGVEDLLKFLRTLLAFVIYTNPKEKSRFHVFHVSSYF